MSLSRDLREIPLFSEFKDPEAKAFANLMDEHEYKDGKFL